MSAEHAERLAVVPVRHGIPATGAVAALAATAGRVLLVGNDAAAAAAQLPPTVVAPIGVLEAVAFQPAAWAAALAPHAQGAPVVVLPASADGRDLAPRLAAELGRPLLSSAIEVGTRTATVSRWGGHAAEEVPLPAGCVVTLEPGPSGATAAPEADRSDTTALALEALGTITPEDPPHDAEVLEVLEPDVATMDLAEAPRLFGAGAGLGSAELVALLGRVAGAADASLGATRVVTDAGWLAHERQIGTTGVVVAPQLYVAFGVSGAVQHTNGLGHPRHIVAVNVDPHCPMMAMADLAVVADAPAVVRALAERLGVAGATVEGADQDA